MDSAQITLLIIQVIILIIQCTSEIRERKRSRSTQKGIFQIGYNNNGYLEFDKDTKGKWTYDFNNRIPFKNIGDDAVTLIKTEIVLDDHIILSPNKGVIFSNKEDFSVLEVEVPVNKNEDKKELSIKFCFILKNSLGYKYVQIIKTKFEHDNEYWKLSEYGWKFKKYQVFLSLIRNMYVRIIKNDY